MQVSILFTFLHCCFLHMTSFGFESNRNLKILIFMWRHGGGGDILLSLFQRLAFPRVESSLFFPKLSRSLSYTNAIKEPWICNCGVRPVLSKIVEEIILHESHRGMRAIRACNPSWQDWVLDDLEALGVRPTVVVHIGQHTRNTAGNLN